MKIAPLLCALRGGALVLCAMCCVVPAVRAELVRDLYAARVVVDDRSAGQREAAARQGLAQVLVKVSGSQDTPALPTLAEAAENASAYLQQYVYTDRADGGLELVLQFDADALEGLIVDSGAPLWTANRPVVLVWLVVEGPNGRDFVTRDTHPELAAALVDAFGQRGLPLRTPLMDLQDTASLSPAQAWQLSAGAVAAASARYGVTQVLVGRAVRLSTGTWLGDWLYLEGDRHLNRSLSAENSADLLVAGAALVADSLASRYAVAPMRALDDRAARLEVIGIATMADYLAVVSWLESLELVDAADLELLSGETMRLRLRSRADLSQLLPLIELNARLQPQAAAGSGQLLVYRWQN